MLILKYIKEFDLKDLNIIEIGGGYGGLCYYLKNIAELYNINISSYTIFDLEFVNNLQNNFKSFHFIVKHLYILYYLFFN